MKIIADESVNYILVKDIRNNGMEVLSIAEDYPSLKDVDIAILSRVPPSIIITEDKDFGELVYKSKVEMKAVSCFDTSILNCQQSGRNFSTYCYSILMSYIIPLQSSLQIKYALEHYNDTTAHYTS